MNNHILVLDLDETLLKSVEQQHFNYNKCTTEDRKIEIEFIAKDGNFYKYVTILRPGIWEFINEVTLHFSKVIVWTAAEKAYAEKLIPHIFKNTKPHDILTQSDCYEVPNQDCITKPLIFLANKYDVYHKNVLIIDDTNYAVMCNPNNNIKIPAYRPITGGYEEDDCLYVLMNYFRSNHFKSNAFPSDCDRSKIEWKLVAGY